MGEPKNLQSVVENAVAKAFEGLLPAVKEEVVRQILTEMGSVAGGGGASDSAKLNEALAAIENGHTQVEILDALIEAASQFTARAALYVVRGANAVGWKARGFENNDEVRSTPLDMSEGLAKTAIHDRCNVRGSGAQFVAGWTDKFGMPQQEVMALPLIVREKVVALMYCDGGTDHHSMDTAAVEALVRTTSLWLEVFASRKVTGSVAAAEHHTPAPVMAAAAAASVSPTTVVEAPPPPPPPPVEHAPKEEAKHEPVPAAGSADVHKKAKRFAKLLVDEIKLYNQSKVAEGRESRDLYDRLKEDIEKSRASYEKRYGSTPAKDGDYFNQELIRILADNDKSLLGSNFPEQSALN
jgi:hypothetical protein